MFPNRWMGHNSLPPRGGGMRRGRGYAGMPPMRYQQENFQYAHNQFYWYVNFGNKTINKMGGEILL